MQRDRYPDDWEAISKHIRFNRAGNKCEWCGVPNHARIVRKPKTTEYLIIDLDAYAVYSWPDGTPIKLSELPEGFDYDREIKVVLTVAHLGTPHPDGRPGDKHDKMDIREENLAALCQRCHLLYDIDEHVAHAKETRLRKKQARIQAAGQLSLFGGAS